LPEEIYRVTSTDHRATREALQRQPGVLTVQPMGRELHLFLNPALTSPEKLVSLTPFEYQKIQPSLEDVFIHFTGRTLRDEPAKKVSMFVGAGMPQQR